MITKCLVYLSLLFILVFSVSCDEDYVYQYDPDRVERNSDTPGLNKYYLKDMPLDNKVDIVFVVDNSGSMGPIQENIIKNAKLFMQEFIDRTYIDWKIGIVSTDIRDYWYETYLGFDSYYGVDSINYEDPSSIDRGIREFQDAMSELGTSGDGNEYVFKAVEKAVKKYANPDSELTPFVRTTSHLAVIMVTDEKEQSQQYFSQPKELVSDLQSMVGGFKVVRFYGALQANSFDDCDYNSYSFNYEGSRYEKIVNLTNGFTISACADDFGVKLADISKDIASLITSPGLPLKKRPKVHTIKVKYKGKELTPGPEAEGHQWFYDDRYNKIVFYSLDWVENFKKDFLIINFDIDDGVPRNGDPETGSRDQ